MRRSWASIVLAMSSVVAVAGQGSNSPRFQFEKIAAAAVTGPQRLDIDVDLLSGSRPFTVVRRGERAIAINGLGDLRLFSNDVEVPYLLIPPAADEPVYLSPRLLPIAAIETQDTKSSGFEIDVLSASPTDSTPGHFPVVDAVDLDAIGAPFLKRFRLEGSGDRVRWTELIAEGTAFNLPQEGIRHTLIAFPAGDYRYLRVTWDDTHSARVSLPSRVRVRQVAQSSSGPKLRASVTVARRQSEPGRSRFRLTLPAARLPIVALELHVDGGNLLRDARVLETGLVETQAVPRLLGQIRLTRVVQGAVAADALRIPIALPAEPQLDLVVDDGDNSPLELTGVTAIFAELPWIYFETGAPGPIVARYGDPRLAPPRYDLEAARPTISGTPVRASWRPQPPVTLTVEPEGLPLPETGSAMSTEGFGYSRDIPEGPAGLISVPLDAAVMAHSGIAPRRLQDLRVIDRSGLQIPYLLERRDEPLIVDALLERRALPAGVQAGSPRSSSYAVHPPFAELPDARLVLTTRARIFQRTLTLGTVVPPSDRQPARFVSHTTAAWTHADQQTAAPALTFPLSGLPRGDLFLMVEEGDNQPLPIDKASVLMPAYAMRLYRRPGLPLRLIYGNDRVGSPQYDLQLLAPHVLGRAAEEVTAGPERALNAAGGDPSRELVSPTVFWSVLGATVVFLLGLVVRLMRRDAIQL